MNPARILTVCMAAVLVAGSAALAAAPGADGKMNALPTYTLPGSAAADGKLAEWAGVSPVPAGCKVEFPALELRNAIRLV